MVDKGCPCRSMGDYAPDAGDRHRQSNCHGRRGIALLRDCFCCRVPRRGVAHGPASRLARWCLRSAITIIEVALIVSVMISAPEDKAGLARDTVFAAVMIVMNGIVGLCFLLGGMRHHEQGFHVQGAGAALAVLAALTTLTMVVPNVVSTAGPMFSVPQLIFAGLVSLTLYGAFIFVQTVRHRDYFLAEADDGDLHAVSTLQQNDSHQCSIVALSLVAVVGLAKSLTPVVEAGISWFGMPKAVVGIVIAGVVLLPECVAALKSCTGQSASEQLEPGIRIGARSDRPHHTRSCACFNCNRPASSPRPG